MVEPLDADERAFARLMQIQIGAVKVCPMCGVQKPIQAFPRYGAPRCADCVRESPHEDWWMAQKARLAGVA